MSETPKEREPVDAFLFRTLGDQPGRASRLLQENPVLAQAVSRRLAEEPLPDGVLPMTMPIVPDNPAPEAYVMHNHTQRCTMCNTEHKFSEVFAQFTIKGRYGIGNVLNLRPVSKLEWQVPLRVITQPTRSVCGCFECFDAVRDVVLSVLPKPPVPQLTAQVTSATARPTMVAASATGSTGPKKPPQVSDFVV